MRTAEPGWSALVLLRHGESTANLASTFTGVLDVELTSQGVAETHAAAALVRTSGLLPDAVFTSTRSPPHLTPGHARHSAGRPQPKYSTSSYCCSNKPVLLRPVESAQYTSIRFTDTLVLEGLDASVGSVGEAHDDAAAETVMGLYKNEAIEKGSPFWTSPLKTEADVEEITFDWVDWYNNERLHSTLGNVPPEEFEQTYYARNIGSPTGDAANKTAA